MVKPASTKIPHQLPRLTPPYAPGTMGDAVVLALKELFATAEMRLFLQTMGTGSPSPRLVLTLKSFKNARPPLHAARPSRRGPCDSGCS